MAKSKNTMMIALYTNKSRNAKTADSDNNDGNSTMYLSLSLKEYINFSRLDETFLPVRISSMFIFCAGCLSLEISVFCPVSYLAGEKKRYWKDEESFIEHVFNHQSGFY